MWTHYCRADRCWYQVGTGELCNWCDTLDNSSGKQTLNLQENSAMTYSGVIIVEGI